MMKKITLATITTLALMTVTAGAEGVKCDTPKCKIEQTKAQGTSCDKGQGCNKPAKSCAKKSMKKAASPLLMPLPSPMRWIMMHGKDATLALSPEQVDKLEKQHNEMMPKMMKLKTDIASLSKSIKSACKKGMSAVEQKENVQKLAILKAEATMTKLTCIEGVKSILNENQWQRLKTLRAGKKTMKKMSGTKEMKCAPGKCGGNN